MKRLTNILLTNDDGIDAPGLQAMHATITKWMPNADILVVAPDRGRSECSHSVTNSRPLIIHEERRGWFAVDGTPVDCVRVALAALVRPDYVFSGINAGANLGTNLMISGTYAGAREAALQGVHAMAISHYRHPDVPRTWDHCPDWLTESLQLFSVACSNGETQLWNVNLPALDPTSDPPSPLECEVDQCPIPRTAVRKGDAVTFELDFHNRPRQTGSDVDLCFQGQVTISRLSPFV